MIESRLPVPRDVLDPAHFAEHHTCVLAAPVKRCADAVHRITVAEVRLMSPLLAARSLPALLSRRRGPASPDRPSLALPGDAPLFESMTRAGFELIGSGPEGIVLTNIGQPHRVGGGQLRKVGSVEAFAAFDEPGYCKIIMDLRVAGPTGRVTVSTDTLVGCTDEATRRAFARYWLLIRPFSGLIRHSMLAAVRRRAYRRH